MTTQDPALHARNDGAIGWLTLSNPPRLNAITFDMWRTMPAAIESFVADPDIRMIVITGEGDRAFSAGADISQFEKQRSSGDALAQYNQAIKTATHALLECPKPTIAKVRGVCVGGGLALALDCDLRFCSDDAMFRMPAARLGLGYEFAGIERMVQMIGFAHTYDVFFSARKIRASEAASMGLVTRMFPATEFDQGFAEYCALVADNAPLTMAAAKFAIRQIARDAGERDMERVEAMYRACFASEDYAEGRRAFLEKRTPKFRGR
ncbi:MAG: enoyl-CoA hydratase [Betaproteobacteria bacterium]|nr:enoyl-CoA hydratase [Betaproteobacteria bacterium]